jgi:hypothetical protein
MLSSLTSTEIDDDIAYHFTSPDKLSLILDSGELLLGSYANTNDPRENKNWPAILNQNSETHDHENWKTRALYDDTVLQKSARLTCLSMDDDSSSYSTSEKSTLLHRGWARSRMWAQYASNQTGACLVFDKHKLYERSVETIHTTPERICMRGTIKYTNEPPGKPSVEVQSSGNGEGIFSLRGDQLIDRFFRKYRDWSQEAEYRILVLTDPCSSEYRVALHSSLKAIILGERFPASERSVIKYRLGDADLESVPIYECDWEGLTPHLSEFYPQAKSRNEI